ncbi:MAG: hypothetical protein ACREQQ_06185 [Candidatus Binatia bacterium]
MDLLLRLMAAEYRTEVGGKKVAYHNKPSDEAGYRAFRRVVLHLSTIQDRNGLYAEPLIFEERWTVAAGSVTPQALQSLHSDFSVAHEPRGGVYRISKRTIGRIMITNYDPEVLSNEERRRLHEEAQRNLDDEVIVDVRGGYVGGEIPLQGKFRLRSFSNVIGFLGRAMGEEAEYDVARDPRTPATSENPVSTLAIDELESAPRAERAVEYGGRHYAVRAESGYQWNKKAFMLLSQLYQMTVVKLPQGGAPSITIAK